MMKLRHLGPCLLGVALLSAAVARADERPSASIEEPFVSNGSVTLRLSAGGYRIVESDDDRIRLRWSVRHEHELARVKARTKIDGANARIELDGPRNHFRAVIEVPKHSDLVIRLSAGELEVGEIEGDKDIRLRAGQLTVHVGDPATYRRVEGSVWAGEIDAGPFHRETGGLFRSLDWKGDGEYELRARLRAGELEFR